MKNKTILILSLCVLIAISACLISTSYAAIKPILTLQYNYLYTAKTPQLSFSGKTVTSTGDVHVTKCDIIYKKSDGKLYVDKDQVLTLSGGNYTFTSTNAEIASIVRVLPVETHYENEDGVDVTVNYLNEYIHEFKDLEIANNAKAYNNVFEFLFDQNQSKRNVSRVLCFMRDVSVESDFTVEFPCSVELFDTTLTISENCNLALAHSYPGEYYIRKETGGCLTLGTDAALTLKTPSAHYTVDDGITFTVVAADSTASIDYVINRALDFACDQISPYPTKNLMLQSAYQTYGVELTYEIGANPFVDGVPFDGIVSNLKGQEKTIRVTATYNGESDYRDVVIKVVDIENNIYLTDALAEMAKRYVYTDNNSKGTSGFNLSVVIQDIFGDSIPDGKTLTVYLTDNSGLKITDENKTLLKSDDYTVRTIEQVGETPAYSFARVSGSLKDGDVYKILYVRKGTVNIADEFNLYFEYGDTPADPSSIADLPASSDCTFVLEHSSPDEILYYLKSVTHAFITNEAYGVLNLKDGSICSGNKVLTGTPLGIETISGEFIGETKATHATLTDAYIKSQYFTADESGYIYRLKNSSTTISKDHILRYQYTVKFDGIDEPMVFSIPIYSALLGAGGDSEMFTSDNELASYFINQEANWLAPADLGLIKEGEFTYIEILSINDIPYGSIPSTNTLKKMISFDPLVVIEASDKTQVTNETYGFVDKDFFRNYTMFINPNYVPATNTVVTFNCYLYNTALETKVNNYEYKIIVPGILKCQGSTYYNYTANGAPWENTGATPNTFTDKTFYKIIEDAVGADYLSEVYIDMSRTVTEQVMLASARYFEGTKMNMEESITVAGVGNLKLVSGSDYNSLILSSTKTIENVDGIEVFTRINAISINGIKVSGNIDAMARCGLNLKYFSAKNCNLTDGRIGTALSNVYLEAVDISSNSIENVNNLLMRTVKYVDLSDNNISAIEGLESLKDIIWLDISNNKIKRFEPLKKLEKLSTVSLLGNLIAGDAINAYGSTGNVNIPVYVWIMKTSATNIYAGAPTSSVDCGNGKIYGYSLTSEQIEGSLALNAFALPTVIKSAQQLVIAVDFSEPLNVSYNGTPSTYTFKFIGKDGTEIAPSSLLVGDKSAFASGKTLPKYIDEGTIPVDGSITDGTVCYYKLAIYKDGVLLAQREFCIKWGESA